MKHLMLISMLRTFSPCSICADSIASCLLRKHFEIWFCADILFSSLDPISPQHDRSNRELISGSVRSSFNFVEAFVFRLDNSSLWRPLQRTIMFGNSSWKSCLYHVIPCDHLLITRLFHYRRKRSLCFPNTFFLTIPTGKDYTIRSFVACSGRGCLTCFIASFPASPDFHPSEIWYFLHHKSN